MGRFFKLMAVLLTVVFPTGSFSHSGRTDAQGGHSNRKTGKYHYHKNPKRDPRPDRALSSYEVRVVGVSDGDTIKVLTDDKREIKIRLANIDTPERHQPYGKRAKQTLSDLIFRKRVEIRTQKIDRYGRTVALVLLDGVDVSAIMVTKGMAWVYRKYNKDSSLIDIEREARSSKRGLWADPNPIPPWEWRKRRRNESRIHFDNKNQKYWRKFVRYRNDERQLYTPSAVHTGRLCRPKSV